jgi:hypothetical protein
MKRNEKRLAIAGMAGGLMLATAAAPSARAGLIVTLTEVGVGSFTATDNVSNDNDPTLGSIDTTHTFPDFTTNITVGFSNKTDPNAGPEAEIDVSSIDITKTGNSAPHTLIVTVSDDGFVFPGNSGDKMMLTSSLGGTATNVVAGSGDNLTFVSTADSTNTPTQSAVLPPGTNAAFTALPDPSTTTFVRGASYTLSNTTTLNLSGSNEKINFSGSTTTVSLGPNVPEPTPAMLALLGIAPLLLSRRRRATAKV